MHKLIEYACDKLEELEKKAEKGNLSMAETEYAEVLSSLKKNLLKGDMLYDEVMENGEYSGAMRPMSDMGGTYRGGSYNRNRDGGMSYARGRGRNARRDSMGRYSSEDGYSRDAADMTAELQELMDDPKYAPVKHDIERLMRKVEQM